MSSSGRDAEQSEGATVTDSSSTPGQEASKIDTIVSHSARIWNYWLGGKDNYPVDREVGDQFCQIFPDIIPVARASRAFNARSVRYLAGEAGIRQFLDIGTGLPSADNTHEVAQAVAPECRIVYVDNDPLVRDVDAYAIVNQLMDALPSGSYLALNDGTNVVRGRIRGGHSSLEPGQLGPVPPAQHRADCPFLRRPGTRGTRRGLGSALAARSESLRRPCRGGRVRRRGAKALTG